ncbi:MAG: phosphoribosyltransferase family protein [Microgenomates group bacterium]|nr:phosphoribosyltransferase family protein [Microgenomates group bacterium]
MPSKMNYKKISWQDFEKDSLKLSQKIKERKISLSKIVAISRGGLVIARILSDLLTLPVSNIVISSYKDMRQLKEPQIIEVSPSSFINENLLIVDEVSDSGKTFKRALSYFKNLPVAAIYTASPYIKPKTAFVPDFYIKTIDAWIIFPYDIKETYQAFLKKFSSAKKAVNKMSRLGFKNWELQNILK